MKNSKRIGKHHTYHASNDKNRNETDKIKETKNAKKQHTYLIWQKIRGERNKKCEPNAICMNLNCDIVILFTVYRSMNNVTMGSLLMPYAAALGSLNSFHKL